MTVFSGKPEDFEAHESTFVSYLRVMDNNQRRKNIDKGRKTHYLAADMLYKNYERPVDYEATVNDTKLNSEQISKLSKQLDHDTATDTFKHSVNKTMPKAYVNANQQFIRDNTPFDIWSKIKSRYSTRTYIHLRGMVWKILRIEPRASNCDTLFDFIHKLHDQINQMGKDLFDTERPIISPEMLCLIITGFLPDDDFNSMGWEKTDFTIESCRSKLKNRFGSAKMTWMNNRTTQRTTNKEINLIQTEQRKRQRNDNYGKVPECFHCKGPHYKNPSDNGSTQGCLLFKEFVSDIKNGTLKNDYDKKERIKHDIVKQEKSASMNNIECKPVEKPTNDKAETAAEDTNTLMINTFNGATDEELEDLMEGVDFFNDNEDNLQVRLITMIQKFNDTKNLVVCDSGAGTSVGHKRCMFTRISSCQGTNLQFPNKTQSNSRLEGTISLNLNTYYKRQTSVLKLSNIPFNSEMDKTIIQEYALLQSGYKVSSTKNGNYKIYTTLQKDNFLLAKAINGIYYIHFTITNEKEIHSINVIGQRKLERIVKKWHMILGHCHKHRLATMALKYNLPEFDGYSLSDILNVKFYCNTCPPAKMKQLSFRNKVGTRPLMELECLHSDSNGPFKVNGRFGTILTIKHILVIIDDHTSYKWVFFLQTLKELSSTFIKLLNELKLQYPDLPVKKIRADGHSTYKEGALKTYCSKNGIQQQFSVVETQQENGGPERYNRTLLEGARALLKTANVPLSYWPEAVNTLNFTQNLLITTRLKKTPHEVFTKKNYNYKTLKVFGAVCDAYIPPNKRTDKKLGDHSVRCRFVGYSITHKAYRLITCGQYPKFILSGNVQFNDVYLDKMIKRNYNTTEERIDDIPLHLPIKTHSTSDESDGNVGESNTKENDNHDDEDEVHIQPSQITTEKNHHSDGAQQKRKSMDSPPKRSTRKKTKILRLHNINQVIAQVYANDKKGQKRIKLPKSYKMAMIGTDRAKWKEACDAEYQSMIDNGTWTLTKLPHGRKALRHRWVLDVKYLSSGEIERYKARIVLMGNYQIFGVDFTETFAPVAKYESFRLLLALSAKLGLEVHQMDVKTAFLNSVIDAEIYMIQPEGYVQDPTLVCRLNKSLYGAKQAGRLWAQLLHTTLVKLEYTNCHKDVCLYKKRVGENGGLLLLLVYVDDIIIASNEPTYLQKAKMELKEHFEMKDMGKVEYALKIKITQDLKKGTITLTQEKYVNDILDKFDMELIEPVATPQNPNLQLEVGLKMTEDQIKKNPIKYRELVGAFHYLVRGTRPDIANSVRELSKFLTCFNQTHWNAAVRVLKYLKGSSKYGLEYNNYNTKIQYELYCDASFASREDGRY